MSWDTSLFLLFFFVRFGIIRLPPSIPPRIPEERASESLYRSRTDRSSTYLLPLFNPSLGLRGGEGLVKQPNH